MKKTALFVAATALLACGGNSVAPDGAGGAGAASTAEHTASSAAHTASSASSAASTATSTSDASSSSSGAGGSTPSGCSGDKPDATNTGVPAAVQLTVVDHDVEVTQDGTVIDGQDIHGFLTINASHVVVRNTVVRGYATDATTAIIRVASGTDVLIEDVDVDAAEPSVDVDGVSGSNFTARRLHVRGGVDGMKLGSNTTVECSLIEDLASFASDPNQGGGPTHNDAIQILEGTTIHVVGNVLLAGMDQNAAIQVTQDFGLVRDLHIEGNWADGGGCTFNFSHNGGEALTDLHTRDNRFGRGSFFDCPILKSTQTTLDSMGDVWDDDGTPVPVQTHD